MAARIRPATSDDAASIAAIHVQCWREAYAGVVPDAHLAQLSVEQRTAQWARQLATPDTAVHVAEDDQGIIGFVSAGKSRECSEEYTGEIYALYLRASHHRRGIGRQLFHAAIEGLRRRGHRSALVWVLEANPSRGFYDAVGGTRLELRKQCSFGDVKLAEVAYGWDPLPPVAHG